MKNINYIRHTSYLRNSIAYDHNLWCTSVKWCFFIFFFRFFVVFIFSGVFFIFSKFRFFGLLVGWKCKKKPKMTKNFVCGAPYLRNYISYDFHFWYTLHMIISLGFYLCFQNFDWVCKRVKGQKMAQNDKKLSLSHLISQEPYIIWSSFSVHMCKRIIFPGVFL